MTYSNIAQKQLQSLHIMDIIKQDLIKYFQIFFLKFINEKKVPKTNKEKLYTELSTLSTTFIYSCRMVNKLSSSKIRFVTSVKSTFFSHKKTFISQVIYCRLISEYKLN